jgi:hypothetical protein
MTVSDDGTRGYFVSIGSITTTTLADPSVPPNNGLVIYDLTDIQQRRPNPVPKGHWRGLLERRFDGAAHDPSDNQGQEVRIFVRRRRLWRHDEPGTARCGVRRGPDAVPVGKDHRHQQ